MNYMKSCVILNKKLFRCVGLKRKYNWIFPIKKVILYSKSDFTYVNDYLNRRLFSNIFRRFCLKNNKYLLSKSAIQKHYNYKTEKHRENKWFCILSLKLNGSLSKKILPYTKKRQLHRNCLFIKQLSHLFSMTLFKFLSTPTRARIITPDLRFYPYWLLFHRR